MCKKFRLFWQSAIFSVLVTISLIGVGCRLFDGGLPGEVTAYLERKAEPLTLNYEPANQAVFSLNPYREKSEVLLIGETHGSAFNYQVFFAVLRSLIQSGRQAQILDEGGYANSLVVNRYLQTGDELQLIYLLNALTGSVAANEQYYQFVRQIRILNESLPEAEKIRFWGIDLEHQLDIALYGIHRLVPENSIQPRPADLDLIPELLAPLLEVRFNRSAYPSGHYNRIRDFFLALDRGLESRKDEYSRYLGSHFPEFAWVTAAAKASINWYAGGSSDNAMREEFMYSQFLRIQKTVPGNSILSGLFGMEHVYKLSGKRTTIANLMHTRNDSPVKGMVTGIHLFYLDSFRLDQKTGAGKKIITDFQDDLREFSRGPATVFSLDEDGSPFRDGCYLVFPDVKTGSNPTTDYFNLIGIIAGSPACIRWRVQ